MPGGTGAAPRRGAERGDESVAGRVAAREWRMPDSIDQQRPDRFLEFRGRHGTGQHGNRSGPVVDENQPGRAADPGRLAIFHVGRDPLFHGLGRQTFAERGSLKSLRSRQLHHRIPAVLSGHALAIPLRSPHDAVGVRPETGAAALQGGADRGTGVPGGRGIVEAQWEIPPDEVDLIGHLGHHALRRLVKLLAVRTLEVGVDDDRSGSVRPAQDKIPTGVDGAGIPGHCGAERFRLLLLQSRIGLLLVANALQALGHRLVQRPRPLELLDELIGRRRLRLNAGTDRQRDKEEGELVQDSIHWSPTGDVGAKEGDVADNIMLSSQGRPPSKMTGGHEFWIGADL